jgi:hypothetical protein
MERRLKTLERAKIIIILQIKLHSTDIKGDNMFKGFKKILSQREFGVMVLEEDGTLEDLQKEYKRRFEGTKYASGPNSSGE